MHRLPLSGNLARGIRGDGSLVRSLIDRIRPDIVFNYAAQTWATDCFFELLEAEQWPRMVMAPCGFSGLGKSRYAAYFTDMPAILRSYDALIFPSEAYQDWRFAHEAGVDRIYIVPNGADPTTSTGEDLRRMIPQGQVVVTVGSHVVSKGHATFSRLIRKLAKHRDLTGVIVAPPRRGKDAIRGCNLTCQARARTTHGLVVLDGSPPGVVADALAGADLFMFTSRLESGPLVILEAMASETPWLSFDVGHASRLAGGIVAGGVAEMGELAEQILDGAHPQLGAEGRRAWSADHRWEDIVRRYEAVFEEVLSANLRETPTSQ